MKSESTIMPAPCEIIIDGDFAEAILIENAEEIQSENEQIKWVWDEYRLRVKNRAGLVEDIERGFDTWLQAAKDLDYATAAADVREKRNALLQATDAKFLIDRINIPVPDKITSTTLLTVVKDFFAALSPYVSGDMAKYRQELRDIPQNDLFPYNIDFPNPPEQK